MWIISRLHQGQTSSDENQITTQRSSLPDSR
jgi:hypothetical protein